MIPITSKECHFISLTIRAIFNKKRIVHIHYRLSFQTKFNVSRSYNGLFYGLCMKAKI